MPFFQRLAAGLCFCVTGSVIVVSAQSPPAPEALSLVQAIAFASTHYPAIEAAAAQTAASQSGTRVASTAYLPRLDALWQINRATSNNIIGLLMPQSVVPSISGPPFPASSGNSAWGSAGGALLSWEPFDLGLRRAAVQEAEAAFARAASQEVLTTLTVQQAVSLTYLAVATAQYTVAAADADIRRRDVLARAVHTLVDNQLRPGVEASRADAELAAARTRAIQARQMLAIAEADLTRALGVPGPVTANVDWLRSDPPTVTPKASTNHPLVTAGQAAVDEAQARETVLARTDRPRVYLLSSVSARGSSISTDGTFAGGASGLGVDRANWAAGVQVVLPNLFDFASLRARQSAAGALTRAEAAHRDEATLLVARERRAASAQMEAATAIAQNTPIQLAAARQTETQARARYDAGLATLVEVAEAQNLLVAAEYQDAAAKVDLWRARLAQAVASGSIEPFVDALKTAGVQ